VKVGDRVKKGQTVCIIEAMKLMNEIEVSNRLHIRRDTPRGPKVA
jgi:acetyl/propionyl-CoA carboxylase alpha subunit